MLSRDPPSLCSNWGSCGSDMQFATTSEEHIHGIILNSILNYVVAMEPAGAAGQKLC